MADAPFTQPKVPRVLAEDDGIDEVVEEIAAGVVGERRGITLGIARGSLAIWQKRARLLADGRRQSRGDEGEGIKLRLQHQLKLLSRRQRRRDRKSTRL